MLHIRRWVGCHLNDAVLSPHPPLHKGEKKMDYAQKLQRMDEHLKDHPHDYQTVISRLKTASKAYDYEIKKKRDMRLKRVAEIRDRLREEDEARNGKEHK